MASVKFEKCSREWSMFRDYWILCQKFYIPEEDDEYWDQMNLAICIFMDNYRNICFSKELALGFIGYIEKQYKEKIAKNEKNIKT